MFDIAPTELMLVAVVALVVIGPKDLPRVLRVVGNWVGKARGLARHFRSGLDEMIRQSELEEMEKKWAAENERIMREHPPETGSAADADAAAPLETMPHGPNRTYSVEPGNDEPEDVPAATSDGAPATDVPATDQDEEARRP